MKITCHSCGAKYTVSDEKVQGKTVKMKCRKCGATIVVGGAAQGDGTALDDSALSHAADGGAPEGPPPGSFLVSVTESDQRTMTLGEVVEAYNGGVITADTYVFADGMSDWQALQDNEAIVAALNEAAVVSQSVTNGTAGYAAQPAMASAPAPQAYAQPAPQAYAQPAASPAAARRDSGRKSQDLFGGGGGYGADSGAGLSSASSLASQSSPGKRDENSVLFSLNALTAATAPAARPSATTGTKEDSGLIDLKALSANAPAAPAVAASAPMVDAVGMFPLGAPIAPPPVQHAGYAMPAAAPPSGGSKLGLIIGGVIAVCAVAIVFLLVLKGDEKKPETTASKKDDTATTATATATVTASAAATAETSASAVASTDESASASASATAVAVVPGKGWKGTPKGTTKPTSGGTTPATTGGPKTPAKGACGCAPSDLNCALKCSVGKK